MANDDENTTARRLEAGQVIDGFRLEERTHQGGMANLWRVTRVEGGDGTPLQTCSSAPIQFGTQTWLASQAVPARHPALQTRRFNVSANAPREP